MSSFLQRSTNHLKNPRYQQEKSSIVNEKVRKTQPILISPSYILIENFNYFDVYQSIVEVTNRFAHSIRLKVCNLEEKGFKIIDVKMPKIKDAAVGTLAPGMSLKIHVIFKAETDEVDIFTKIQIKVESFDEVFEIPCNARNKPPVLKQVGVDKPNERLFYCGSCWLGDRLDSVFRIYNEGGSSTFKLVDVDRMSEGPEIQSDPKLKSPENSLILENPEGRLRVLQGFNKFADTTSSVSNSNSATQNVNSSTKKDEEDSKEKDKEKDPNETSRVRMPVQDPTHLDMQPFTVFPQEFFIESESYIDVYVIFNPKQGNLYNKTLGFSCEDKILEYFQLSGIGIMVNLAYTRYMEHSLVMGERSLQLENILFQHATLNKVHSREFSIRNTCPLPIKVKWDKYDKDRVFSKASNIQITPNSLLMDPESDYTFKLLFTPSKVGYENYNAILTCEGVHRLAMGNSPVLKEIDNNKTKYNILGNTTHVTLPFFKVNIECLVVKNEITLVNPTVVKQSPVVIFSKCTYSITIKNNLKSAFNISIGQINTHELVKVYVQDACEGSLNILKEELTFNVSFVAYKLGDYNIKIRFDVEDGDSYDHIYRFSVAGPTVSILNPHIFVTELKANVSKMYPLTLRNDTPVDAEILILYEDAQSMTFNYHFISDKIEDEHYAWDVAHVNNMMEQFNYMDLSDDKNKTSNTFFKRSNSFTQPNVQNYKDNNNKDSQIYNANLQQKDGSNISGNIRKYYNAHQVVNSFNVLEKSEASKYKNSVMMRNHSYVIPPNSTLTVEVQLQYLNEIIETHLIVKTKYGKTKYVTIVIGQDTKVVEKKTKKTSRHASLKYNRHPSVNISRAIDIKEKEKEKGIMQSIREEAYRPGLGSGLGKDSKSTTRNSNMTKGKDKKIHEPKFHSDYNLFGNIFN